METNLDKKMQELKSRFSFHKPDGEGIQKMRAIRRHVRTLAEAIEMLCPESREKATAMTQLSFVMMSANSAIIQSYPIDPDDFNPAEKETAQWT